MTWLVRVLLWLGDCALTYEFVTFLIKYLFWVQFGQGPKPSVPERVVLISAGDKYRAEFPHCDSRILHLPQSCIYCDAYPDAQAARVAQKINFTGESKPGLAPCPADLARPVGSKSNYNNWPGNRAMVVRSLADG